MFIIFLNYQSSQSSKGPNNLNHLRKWESLFPSCLSQYAGIHLLPVRVSIHLNFPLGAGPQRALTSSPSSEVHSGRLTHKQPGAVWGGSRKQALHGTAERTGCWARAPSSDDWLASNTHLLDSKEIWLLIMVTDRTKRDIFACVNNLC